VILLILLDNVTNQV